MTRMSRLGGGLAVLLAGAVAQAQHAVRELADLLEARGVDVKYAIHPVAGRMPGHMNVLLAEAQVPYPQLYDMDDINPEFPRTDVADPLGPRWFEEVMRDVTALGGFTAILGLTLLVAGFLFLDGRHAIALLLVLSVGSGVGLSSLL